MLKILLHILNVVIFDFPAEYFFFFFCGGGEESGECGEGQGVPDPVGVIFHPQKVLGAQERELKVQ